jgi:hypothetical protein
VSQRTSEFSPMTANISLLQPLSILLIFTLSLSVTCFSVSAQTINLDEIIKLRSLDSTELREFCEKKGFKPLGISRGPSRLLFRYYFPQDSSMWFVRSFPMDTTRNKHVYFYHGDANLNKEFKKQISEQGYKFESKQVSDNKGNKTKREIFLKDGMEIILGYESIVDRPKRYVLMFQRQFKMYNGQSPKDQ